MLSLFSK